MSEKIWAIAHGSYSDYGINYMVRTEAEANALAEKMNGPSAGKGRLYTEFEVEEFELVTPDEVEHREHFTLNYHRHWSSTQEPHENEFSRLIWEVGPPSMEVHYSPVNDGRFMLSVSGTDIDRIRKVYSDRKAEIDATLAGLT